MALRTRSSSFGGFSSVAFSVPMDAGRCKCRTIVQPIESTRQPPEVFLGIRDFLRYSRDFISRATEETRLASRTPSPGRQPPQGSMKGAVLQREKSTERFRGSVSLFLLALVPLCFQIRDATL